MRWVRWKPERPTGPKCGQAHEEGISVGLVIGRVSVLANVGSPIKKQVRGRAQAVKDEVQEAFNSCPKSVSEGSMFNENQPPTMLPVVQTFHVFSYMSP